ncbi:MAG: hypothetical protein NW237_10150 [Cyanobacteriota bacterium]|nr:hypothetical protein [Cyanobacteriota bacterium]
MKTFKLVLLSLWGLSLLILMAQNWGSPVTLLPASQNPIVLPLPLALLLFYGIGVALGSLLLGTWAWHDRLLQRQALRWMQRLTSQIEALEVKIYRPEVYLPPDPRANPSTPPQGSENETIDPQDWQTDRWDS